MTTAEVILRCQTLADKYSSAYITDDEWLGHLNMAQYEFLNTLVPDNLGGAVNFDFDENTAQNIAPLTYSTTYAPSSTISYASIATALQTASGDSGCSLFRIMAVYTLSGGVNIPIKYVKRNNIGTYRQNYYKRPSTVNPCYGLINQTVSLEPTPTSTITIDAIKTPKTLTLINSPDFSDYCLNKIIGSALQLAGLQIRDEDIVMDIRNNTIQGIK